MSKKSFRFVFILIWSSYTAFCQNQLELPVLKFLSDSFKLGQHLQLSMSFEHKPTAELLFPDSSYDFSPFEFVKKEYFPTKTKKNSSKDSVVYTLMAFELESQLALSLPVFMFQDGDTTRLYSDEAIIKLKEEITNVTQKDSLRVDTRFLAMNSKLNYPYIGIGLLVLVCIGLVIFIFFRKKLIAQYKLYFLQKDFQKFSVDYAKITFEYHRNQSVSLLEEQLSLWKKYIGKLDRKPYPSFTTKELAKIFNQNEITSSLQNYDRAIYGGFIKEDMTNSIHYLEASAKLKFEKKQNELRNI